MSYAAAHSFVDLCQLALTGTLTGGSEDGPVSSVQVGVLYDGEMIVSSDFVDLVIPGDEVSYDMAMSTACSDAEGKFASHLVGYYGLRWDDAEELAYQLPRGAVPVA